MASVYDASTSSEPISSPGRRVAVRSLAGIGAATVALLSICGTLRIARTTLYRALKVRR